MPFYIPTRWNVLVVDDCPERGKWFRARLPKCVLAPTAKKALVLLRRYKFNVIFLDHDLHWMHAADVTAPGSGQDVARILAHMKFQGVVVIHSKNETGAAAMKHILPNAHVARFDSFEIHYGDMPNTRLVHAASAR